MGERACGLQELMPSSARGIGEQDFKQMPRQRQQNAPVACRLSAEVPGDHWTEHVFLFCCHDIWDLADTGEDVPPRASQVLSRKPLDCIPSYTEQPR